MKRFKGKGLFFLLALALAFLAISVVLGTAKKAVRVSMACTTGNFSGQFENELKLAYFEGQELAVPEVGQEKPYVLGVSADGERYIEIDLSEQKLKAWDAGSLFLETPISTGLPWWPTPQGEFRIWIKLRYTRMEGGEGRYYYNLPNVPFVMYFQNNQVPSWRGYGLHGAYWHNAFGTPRSHGCVNLPIPEAEKLYYWTTPTLPDGKNSTYASDENPGTRIVIHE
jgi:lipoprotein-anchoring transpeptidase ErfK/SrfK